MRRDEVISRANLDSGLSLDSYVSEIKDLSYSRAGFTTHPSIVTR